MKTAQMISIVDDGAAIHDDIQFFKVIVGVPISSYDDGGIWHPLFTRVVPVRNEWLAIGNCGMRAACNDTLVKVAHMLLLPGNVHLVEVVCIPHCRQVSSNENSIYGIVMQMLVV